MRFKADTRELGQTVPEACFVAGQTLTFSFSSKNPPREKFPMHQRRTRIVNFRVTEEEYNRLRSASAVAGNLALSAYARHATLRLAESISNQQPSGTNNPEFLLASLAELRSRVADLALKVDRLRDPAEKLHETYA
jgi:hypothetical protein